MAMKTEEQYSKKSSHYRSYYGAFLTVLGEIFHLSEGRNTVNQSC